MSGGLSELSSSLLPNPERAKKRSSQDSQTQSHYSNPATHTTINELQLSDSEVWERSVKVTDVLKTTGSECL